MAGCSCGCACCVARRSRSVYLLLDPRTGVARYVGQAKDVEARVAAHLQDRSGARGAWITELVDEGLRPLVRVIAAGLNESEALRVEAETISSLLTAGLPLLNVHGTRDSQSGPRPVVTFRCEPELSAWVKTYAEASEATTTEVIVAALANLRDDAARGVVALGHAAR